MARQIQNALLSTENKSEQVWNREKKRALFHRKYHRWFYFYFYVYVGIHAGARWSVQWAACCHGVGIDRAIESVQSFKAIRVWVDGGFFFIIGHSIVIYWKCDRHHGPIKLQNNQSFGAKHNGHDRSANVTSTLCDNGTARCICI